MFTNKHILIALLLSPLLAILAWFTVGALVGERPQRALPGQSYPLVESSNCRYDSGQCDLANEEMQLSITLAPQVDGPILRLSASHPLDEVLFAIAAPGEDGVPLQMVREDPRGTHWVLQFNAVPTSAERLHLVVQSGGSQWFADASSAFLARYRAAAGDG